MGQFLAVLVRAMLQDLQSGDHRRIELKLCSETDAVNDAGEPHSASQVVLLRKSIAKPFESRNFRLRNRVEHAELNDISRANIWDLKFTLFLNLLPLFRVDMCE